MLTETPPLDAELTTEVLAFLGVTRRAPTPVLLDRLVTRYTRTVPWESAFRIAKRAATERTADCPRWPQEFWQDAMERGGGGTCFESNYAFFSLLRSLGYQGYLTINDMGDMCGCHTAIVLQVNGARWLVDVGIPLYAPIPLSVRTTWRSSPFHTYAVTPQGDGTFTVTRDRHPKPYIFTLIDRPIADEAYRGATTKDYDPGGHFLKEVIISKVIDDHVWRFNGRVQPPLLASFGPSPTSTPMYGAFVDLLSDRFQMDPDVLAQAFQALQ